MAKIKNTNFFKQPQAAETGSNPAKPETKDQASVSTAQASQTAINSGSANAQHASGIVRHVNLSNELLAQLDQTAMTLSSNGFPSLAKDMERLRKMAVNKSFTVAFVGEFSRGKSTLLNNMLGEEILPTANLPTTALLTRIIYGKEPRLTVFDKSGHKIDQLPLNSQSWENLTAANFGENDPEGSVVVEYNKTWLGEYGVTLIDTPGAGDLEEKRARLIETAMVTADAAIIAIDASKPLSLTEQAFIRQKIKSRGVPFMAIALTRLDLIAPKDRKEVVDYVIKRLDSLGLSMPLFVAGDVEVPGLDNPSTMIGIDKAQKLISKWMADPHRRSLTENWIKINALAILNTARLFLLQQKEIFNAKEDERERLIAERSKALAALHGNWEKLRQELQRRCEKCITDFQNAVKNAGDQMTEALQHEADRQPNPKEWLDKEYAYRVKRELSAISLSVDNLVAKHVAADLKWLNSELSKQFKEIVGNEVEAIASRDDFWPDVDEKALKLKDIRDRSIKATVVSSALTLGTALMLGISGGAPLILATMGVGTGANIISKQLLSKEVERQRSALKKLIADQVPEIIANAANDSAVKIKMVYNDIAIESHNTEARWMTTQRNLIREGLGKQCEEALKKLQSRIEAINEEVVAFGK